MDGSLRIVPARPSSSDGLELPWDVGTAGVATTIAPGGGWIAELASTAPFLLLPPTRIAGRCV
jgi:hypothetical protein